MGMWIGEGGCGEVADWVGEEGGVLVIWVGESRRPAWVPGDVLRGGLTVRRPEIGSCGDTGQVSPRCLLTGDAGNTGNVCIWDSDAEIEGRRSALGPAMSFPARATRRRSRALTRPR